MKENMDVKLVEQNAFLWRVQKIKTFCRDCQAWDADTTISRTGMCRLKAPTIRLGQSSDPFRWPMTLNIDYCFEGVPKEK